jgi:glycosyltransferase involved in cell wall biosynthesis
MYKGQIVSVAIPAYNEERFIGGVVQSIPEWVDHIIVVDDCSTDATYATVEKCADPRTHVLRTERNSGVGAAMVAGYRKALDLESDIVVKVDGDGQMRMDYMDRLLDPLVEDGYMYAKGNRFLDREYLPQMPALRLLGNIALTFLNKLASGYWHVFDPQNGYTAIRSEALRIINLGSIHQRFFFENDMLYHLNLQNARVRDVSIPASYGDEVSDLRVSRILLTFPPLLIRRFFSRIVFKYIVRDFSPIALFLILGGLLFGWGFLFGAFTWVRSLVRDEFASTGTVMLAVLPLIMGFQLILQAIVLDIGETPK